MGVRGLSTYISENSNQYLKPYELCDTYLVIDGNNIGSNLYLRSKSHSAFGGDYDEYYKVVADFFFMLIKCGVTPIVLFDGGYERRKLKTITSRFATRLPTLKKFSKGFTPTKFFPLLMKETFFEVMADMNVFCIQCNFEADIEIATIARALNCPVLSYDSDFFIFDILYIPFPTVCLKPVQYPNSNKHYIRCSIFHVTYLFNEFPGLNKFHLPIIATLLGNDYIESSLFETFFGHVPMPKRKNLTSSHRKILGLFCWLEKENVESATNLILSHVSKKNAAKVLSAIKSSKKNYTSNFVSGAAFSKLQNFKLQNIKLKKKIVDIKLPNKIMELYFEGKIHKLIIDIVSLGVYFTFLQLENVYHQSSHIPALQLILSLYMLLIPYMKNPTPLKLYLSVKNHYGPIKIIKDPKSVLNYVCLSDILKESKQERLKLLCHIVGIDDEDLNLVSVDYWSIFLMSLIYWIKQLKNSLSSTHIKAMVLMAIANKVVQKHVGYFNNYSKFMKHKEAQLSKLKNENLEIGPSTTFNEMLKSVTLYEKLHIYSILFPFRKTTEKGSGKAYNISVLHLFGSFQSCLFHIMQLNALLNCPLPYIKISDFYSGTLLFNFYLVLKNKPDFAQKLFKNTPNLEKIYTHLYGSLSKFLNNVAPQVKKSRRKRNKKKKTIETNTNEVIIYEDDDSNYVDENNLYSALSKVTI